MSHSGQCLCGAIKYEFNNEPAMTGVCHCKNCQRQGGSAFSTLAGVAKDDFRLSGTPKLYEDADTDSGTPVQRYFCEHCGSPLYSALPAMPDMVFVKTGTLDDTSAFTPNFHAWCSTKQNWVTLDDNVPQSAK
ncbi:MAG: GFA family protein [Pseudomonadales bacterium]